MIPGEHPSLQCAITFDAVLVSEYADGMTRSRVEAPESLLASLREQFCDAQSVELTACLAWENQRASMMTSESSRKTLALALALVTTAPSR